MLCSFCFAFPSVRFLFYVFYGSAVPDKKTATNQARNRSGFYPFTEIIEICHNNNSK